MFVSVTRLRLRSARFFLPFAIYAWRSMRQARRSPGNVAVAALRDDHGCFWTRTVWADHASMRAFMTSGAHRQVMPRLLDWCDEAALVHWEQDDATPPRWNDAHRRLLTEGRLSKVRHPSPAQSAFDFPRPQLSDPR